MLHRRGRFYFLKSGGGLLHYSSGTSNAVHPQYRRILFLHGNGGSLDLCADILEMFHSQGYNVFAVEYYTYGICWEGGAGGMWAESQRNQQGGHVDQTHNRPSARDMSQKLIENVLEAWSICGNDHTIVIGFSLGGGLLGMTYNYMLPPPEELVFINTFADMSKVVIDNAPWGMGHVLVPFMSTHWQCEVPAPHLSRATTKVVVISTQNDWLMRQHQAMELLQRMQRLEPVWKELDRGGHALSVVLFMEALAPDSSNVGGGHGYLLLPAIIQ